MKTNERKKHYSINKTIRALAVAASATPIIIALVTPALYLIGKAYYEGFLNHLGIHISMLTQDTPATLAYGIIAVLSGSMLALNITTSFLHEHWHYIFTTFLILTTSISLLNVAEKRLRRNLESIEFTTKLNPQTKHFLEITTTTGFWLFVPLYLVMLCTFAIILFLSPLIVPFFYLGEKQASKDIENGFYDRPLANVIGPHGVPNEYRIILCSENFCALYKDGEIVTASLSKITWATSEIKKIRD